MDEEEGHPFQDVEEEEVEEVEKEKEDAGKEVDDADDDEEAAHSLPLLPVPVFAWSACSRRSSVSDFPGPTGAAAATPTRTSSTQAVLAAVTAMLFFRFGSLWLVEGQSKRGLTMDECAISRFHFFWRTKKQTKKKNKHKTRTKMLAGQASALVFQSACLALRLSNCLLCLSVCSWWLFVLVGCSLPQATHVSLRSFALKGVVKLL